MTARYPLLLDLRDKPVLVAGGGAVAARRVDALVAAGATVTVIAPAIEQSLAFDAQDGLIRWLDREATAADVIEGGHRSGVPEPWALVHVATDDPGTNETLTRAAQRAGTWCVRADDAEASPAHVPAVATGPDGVLVAVSGGFDPGRAVRVRDAIAKLLAVGALPLRRRRPPAPGTLGTVVLVGGGPGDPGLLTLSGRQWLARADVVVTDRLGPRSVLDELDGDVEIVDVGKAAGNHPIPQDRINEILVEHARLGRTVVRLKGGDPFVMGRGAEEALHCLAAGVPVQVVPGVSSATAVPALAGIPVTHRGTTTSMVVASAHAGAGDAVRASREAPDDATLVLLMGLSALRSTADQVIAAGRAPGTPVAVISRGSTPQQRTVRGCLTDIADLVEAAALPGPALVVVGATVDLRGALAGAAGEAAWGPEHRWDAP